MATQEILHGSLLKSGSLPKAAGDAAFQSFLDDKLSKSAGGAVSGSVVFGSGASQFTVDAGVLALEGSGALLIVQGGASVSLSSDVSFSTGCNIDSFATPSAAGHLTTKGYVDAALAAAAVRYAAPRAPATGAVDGVNKVFVFTAVVLAADGEFVEVDGLRVYKTLDYTLATAGGDTTVTFVDAPPADVRVRLGGFLA